jgi:hypothetical protein
MPVGGGQSDPPASRYTVTSSSGVPPGFTATRIAWRVSPDVSGAANSHGPDSGPACHVVQTSHRDSDNPGSRRLAIVTLRRRPRQGRRSRSIAE